jgi:hypothetical protein
MRSSESSPFAVLIVRFLNLDAWDLPGADEFRGVVYANLFDEDLPGISCRPTYLFGLLLKVSLTLLPQRFDRINFL